MPRCVFLCAISLFTCLVAGLSPAVTAADSSTPRRSAPAPGSAAPGSAAPGGAAPALGSPAPLDAALQRLAEEARASWAAAEEEEGDAEPDWPRRRSDFAREPDAPALAPDAVAIALANRLAEDPALDGYLKWQLLSYQPTFVGLSDAHYLALIDAMPPLLAAPAPVFEPTAPPPGSFFIHRRERTVITGLVPIRGTGRFHPVLGVVSSGVTLSVGGAVTGGGRYATLSLHTAITTFQLRQVQVFVLCRPAVRFRDELIEALPTAGGVQLAARLRDLRDRIAAGHRSASDAARALVRAAEAQWNDPSVSDDLRRRLRAELREVHRLRTEVTRSIRAHDNGEIDLHTEVIALDTDDFKRINSALLGHPPDRD